MRFEAIADPAGTAAAMELFNDCSAMGETLFRPFGSPEDFRSFFLRWTEDVIPVALAGEGAFASGCYAKESGKAYVTFVGVRPGCRRRGAGRFPAFPATTTPTRRAWTYPEGDTSF